MTSIKILSLPNFFLHSPTPTLTPVEPTLPPPTAPPEGRGTRIEREGGKWRAMTRRGEGGRKRETKSYKKKAKERERGRD